MRVAWAREAANEYCLIREEAGKVMQEIHETLILGEGERQRTTRWYIERGYEQVERNIEDEM